MSSNSNSNNNNMSLTTATISANNSASTKPATSSNSNDIISLSPSNNTGRSSARPTSKKGQYLHRSGWSFRLHGGKGMPNFLGDIQEESLSASSLVASKKDLKTNNTEQAKPQEEPATTEVLDQKDDKDMQQEQHAASAYCRFMLGREYKLLAMNFSSSASFVSFSTVGSSGLLSLLQGRPVLTDHGVTTTPLEPSTEYMIVGIVQHTAAASPLEEDKDVKSDDESDDNDIKDESLMFWMTSLKNQSVAPIHLSSEEMVERILGMNDDKDGKESTAAPPKRRFLMYSTQDKAFLLKDSKEICKSIQEASGMEVLDDLEPEVAQEEPQTEEGMSKENSAADAKDDAASSKGSGMSLIGKEIPSDKKDEKTGRRRRKLKWSKLLKKMLFIKRRNNGSSTSTAASKDTTTSTAVQPQGEITPTASIEN